MKRVEKLDFFLVVNFHFESLLGSLVADVGNTLTEWYCRCILVLLYKLSWVFSLACRKHQDYSEKLCMIRSPVFFLTSQTVITKKEENIFTKSLKEKWSRINLHSLVLIYLFRKRDIYNMSCVSVSKFVMFHFHKLLFFQKCILDETETRRLSVL